MITAMDIDANPSWQSITACKSMTRFLCSGSEKRSDRLARQILVAISCRGHQHRAEVLGAEYGALEAFGCCQGLAAADNDFESH